MVYAGRGQFTAAVELHQGHQFSISFLHHMATQRNVQNPFEKKGGCHFVVLRKDGGLETSPSAVGRGGQGRVRLTFSTFCCPPYMIFLLSSFSFCVMQQEREVQLCKFPSCLAQMKRLIQAIPA